MSSAEPAVALERRERGRGSAGIARARRLLGPVSLTAWGAIALTVAFGVISIVWVSLDTATPDGDSARHMLFGLQFYDMVRHGDLLGPFNFFDATYNPYPPGVYYVGILGLLIGGVSIPTFVISQNAVFLPLLVAGVYGTARLAYDRRAGLLAVAFALAAPMIISQFHVFMLDAPETAMVAISVFLLLRSDRFARTAWTLAAAVAVGLGMWTKDTFALFVVGLLAVMLARGGWRHWRNVLLFAVIAFALGSPWYIAHYHDLRGVTNGGLGGTSGSAPPIWYDSVPYPKRWTLTDFGWYGWALVNNQLFLPLTLFFGVGLVSAVVGFVRRRLPTDFTPELLAGGFAGYFLMDLWTLNNERYTLPALVYIAVLGTGWIVRAGPRVRWMATGLLFAILLTNTLTTNLSLGKAVKLDLPNPSRLSPIQERRFTVVSDFGYIENDPDRTSRILAMLHAAKVHGATKVFVDVPNASEMFFNARGLTVLARVAGLTTTSTPALGPRDVFVVRRAPRPGDPPPCGIEADTGEAIYLVRGPNPTPDPPPSRFYCPLPPLRS